MNEMSVKPEYGIGDAPCPICGGEKTVITLWTRGGERHVIRGFCSLGCASVGCGAGEGN